MSVLTNPGRAGIAAALAAQPIHLAWGRGDDAWGGTPPAEPVDATALVDETGRRIAHDTAFAEPDDAGEIVVPTGRYRRVDAPTRHLYLAFRYDFEDGAEHVIRELGVFVGTQMIEGLPPGQRYFLPDHVGDPGILLVLEYTQPNYRNAATREEYEFVVTF